MRLAFRFFIYCQPPILAVFYVYRKLICSICKSEKSCIVLHFMYSSNSSNIHQTPLVLVDVTIKKLSGVQKKTIRESQENISIFELYGKNSFNGVKKMIFHLYQHGLDILATVWI